MARFLRDLGTNVYHVEFGGYLTNHLMDGVVALVGLGAPDDRIASFTQYYARQLEPASRTSPDVQITEDTLREFIGKRSHYSELVQFFSARFESLYVSSGSVNPVALLLRHYVPELVDGGLGCAAFHPIIHIGYGLMDTGDDIMPRSRDVIDGLAYMVHSFRRPDGCKPTADVAQSMVQELGISSGIDQWEHKSDLSSILVGLLRELGSDQSVRELMIRLPDLIALPHYTSMEPVSDFQKKMAAIGDQGCDFLDRYTEAALNTLNTKFQTHASQHGDNGPSFITYSMKAIIDGVIQLYASCSTVDDFFILHGVTSAWALRRTLFCFDSVVVQVQLLISYLKSVLSAYISQGMPVVGDELPGLTSLPSWKSIITKTLECSDDVDEHVYKLVFTCHEAEKAYGSPCTQLYRRAAAQKMGFVPWASAD